MCPQPLEFVQEQCYIPTDLWALEAIFYELDILSLLFFQTSIMGKFCLVLNPFKHFFKNTSVQGGPMFHQV
jgi:hypothetical protein